ncbi:MAG TPA: aldehyde dehydrogenase PuuC, partial [Alphaproteobacteria bacterium]|nr:aldehyde dehydrogenase PuuC [Alphaproteobacteria bacterium]
MEKLMAAKTLEDWQKMRDGLSYRNQAFIDGKYVDAASGKTFDCTSPIDGRLLAKVAECDKEDVDRAVKAARKAFEAGKWSEASPAKRKAVMLKLAQLVRENSDELALLETLDMGKPVMMAKNVDMNGVANNFQWYGEAIDKMYDEIAPTDRSGLGLITREPMGVVGAVVPWNFPLMMAAWKLAPMLATGNSVVLKPAEQSPLTAIRLAELAMEAGIPEGVLNVLPGFGETAGQALGMHMDVDGISFTGSTEVGKYFLKYSGLSNMKAIALECGGKTPNIVMKDAPNLEAAAREAGSAIFFNSGQVCLASSRLLVEQDIKDEFLEKVKEVGQFMQPGDPLDPKTMMGTMVDNTQTKRVLGYIEAGQKEGAKLVLGGKQVRQNTGGEYIEPTIFDNVKNSMKIAQEEIFGPVLSTLTFKDAEEAIQIANDSVYGLYANLWTNDLTKAHKMARKIRAGTVNINNTNGGGLVMPFGGYKQS